MAKGVIKKVAQRFVISHYQRRHLTQHSQITRSSSVVSTTDQRGMQTGHSLWVKPSETPFLSDTLEAAVDKLKDDEEIRSELMINGNEVDIPKSSPNIDTHAMVKSLMQSGFTLIQAEALTTTIVVMVGTNSDTLRSSMVSKSHAELTLQKIASQLAILRRDIMIMEKTDFTELLTKIERITHELQQLQRTTKDEITKISSDLTLDFNLEKGKVKDMHLDHLRAVEDKHARIFDRLIALDKELQNVRSCIKTENADLQTTFERYKSDTIKLAFGAVATCMTIVLGFYRLWS